MIAVVIIVVLALAVGMAVFALRRQPAVSPPPLVKPDEEAYAARQAKQRVLDAHGAELLARRVELDARRGTLGGDSVVYSAFEELEQRLRAGEISEQEFETEKVRLLGG